MTTPLVLIRFFATVDLSPHGLVALSHLDALREVTKLPIRLIATNVMDSTVPSRDAQQWARHRDLISTKFEKEFITVVCATPDRWAALRSSKMIRSHYNTPEYPSGCKKNVLVLTELAGAYKSLGYDHVLNEKQVQNVAAAVAAGVSPSDIDLLRRKVNVAALREAIEI